MKVGFVCANSWDFAYPQYADAPDQKIWVQSDDFVMRYPRAVMAYGIEPVFFYLSASARTTARFTHKYGFSMLRVPVRFGAGRFDSEISLRLLHEIAREHCDLIHFYSYYRNRRYPDMYDLFALHAHMRRWPFVAHHQACTFPYANPDSRLKQLALRPRQAIKHKALGYAARLLCLNKAEIAQLTSASTSDGYPLGFDHSKCVYVQNIVDNSLFHPMDRDAACAAIGRNPARRYVLYVGFLREAKGIQDLIASLPPLLAKRPSLQLLVVGNGEHEQTLKRQVLDGGLCDSVSFVGPVANTELRPYYCAADVHVLPSHQEALGVVLLEAMACGIPSVGSNVGGIPEVLSNGLGVLVPPRDPTELARGIDSLLSGDFALNLPARKARLEQHTYAHAGQILSSVYEQIQSEVKT
jgi:glycosyltransferase involved in cell wall biosynthesis